MERWIEQPDRHRKTFHLPVQADEVLFLERQQLVQILFPLLRGPRQNHFLHKGNPDFGKEHVLSPA